MNAALIAVYESAKDKLHGMSADDFAKAFDGWEVVALQHDGEVIGGVLIKGNELHVGYKSAPKASIRSHIKKTLKRLIDTAGYAATTIREENTRGIEFCRRLGFKETKTENGIIHMRCDRCNYV